MEKFFNDLITHLEKQLAHTDHDGFFSGLLPLIATAAITFRDLHMYQTSRRIPLI